MAHDTTTAASAWPRLAPGALHRLFAPTSIAMVGASDKSPWSFQVMNALDKVSYPGVVHMVNARSSEAHGRSAVPTLLDVDGPVDLMYVMVPGSAVLEVIEHAAARGITSGVILSSGFAEAGDEGVERQEALVALAAQHGMALLGPNTLGFLNLPQRVALFPTIWQTPMKAGGVAIVSQSGALGAVVLRYLEAYDQGVSVLASTGNEAVVSVSDIVNHLVDDEQTRAIAVFAESIKHPEALLVAAERALEAGKPIVALKIGRSELAARTAAAHTGSVVGDDRVVDAVFRQAGIIRVDSLEELATTAALLAETGPLRGRRIAALGVSGGSCDIVADRAEEVGLEVPPFTDTTEAALASELPDYATILNPLDVTGAAAGDIGLFARCTSILGADEGIDALVVLYEIGTCGVPPQRREQLANLAPALRNSPIPAIFTTALGQAYQPDERALAAEAGLRLGPGGLDLVVHALGKGAWWSERRRARTAAAPPPALTVGALPAASERTGEWSEARARELLDAAGVPSIPARFVTDADGAATAAAELGFPVVLKAVSPHLQHKSDVGAVRLGLGSPEEVRAAALDVADRVARLTPAPELEGFLISPMRTGGVELLLGVLRDPVWGGVLAVGLGGVWTEVFADVSVRVLPVDSSDVRAMLDELKGSALLQGARGTKPADIDALVEVVMRFGALATALGDDLESLEVNPLLVDGSRIEALDALVSWSQP